MDFSNKSVLILMPPASERDISSVETKMNVILPNSFKDLLRETNGLSVDGGILIYGTQEIIERNETWETQVYAQGYIAIGDDGGGRVFLVHQGYEEEKVLIVDSGDMTPEHSDLVTSDFTQWAKSVFGLNITAVDLLNGSKNLPFILVEEYPYGKARKLSKKLSDLKIELRGTK